MKIVNITESQYRRLFEDIEDWGKSGIPDYQNQEENTITSKIHDKDGDIEDSIPPTTNRFAGMQSDQQWGSRTNRSQVGRI